MSTAAKTLAFAFVNNLAVHLYAHKVLDDRDWDLWLEAASKRPPSASLVFTPGPGPNARQRSKLMETLSRGFSQGATLPLVAVVTPSVLSRGIITALGWVGYDRLKGFEQGEWRSALHYLGVSHLEVEVRQATSALGEELGVTDPLRVGSDESGS